MSNWKEHQNDVAEFFRKLGCKVQVGVKIPGARAKKNEIDVLITFKQYGFNIKWAVECKYWGRTVPKDAISEFKGKIDDIGINKGFVITEKGYQSGAKEVVRYTNVELLTFNQMKRIMRRDLHKIVGNRIIKRINKFRNKIFEMKNKERILFNWVGVLTVEELNINQNKIPKRMQISYNGMISFFYIKNINDYAKVMDKIFKIISKIIRTYEIKK